MLGGAEEAEEEDCGASRLTFLRGVLLGILTSDSESDDTESSRAARFRFPCVLLFGGGGASLLWTGRSLLLVVRRFSYCSCEDERK